MSLYIKYGQFRKALRDHYYRTGISLKVPEMATKLLSTEIYTTKEPKNISVPNNFDVTAYTEDEFQEYIDGLYINFDPIINSGIISEINEDSLIPHFRNAFLIRTFNFSRHHMHRHNYFEINYCVRGSGEFYFEGEHRTIKESELVIIAPESLHDLVTTDDNAIIYTLCLRASTFNNSFFSLMSKKDLLSYFFRTILQGESQSNYLFFYADNNTLLNYCFRNIFLESHRNDQYFNSSTISYVNIMFTTLLRNYSDTIQFYDYKLGTDFSLVLQYIQNNYCTVTLASLAELFHYSEPHLCTLIKQNTGFTFTALIKHLRLTEAMSYLLGSNLKINEIAEKVGYNSTDHFSRVFRGEYGMSPIEYRKKHASTAEVFVPFAES